MIDYDNGYVEGGVVEQISQKPTNAGVFYNIKVDGDWFGFGRDVPEFGEGSVIGFDIKFNGDFANVNNKTLTVEQYVEPQRQGRQGSGRSQGQGRGQGSQQGRGGQRGQGNTSGRGAQQGTASRRPAQQGAASSGGMSKDDYWKNKEERDIEKDKVVNGHACRNSAIATVGLLLSKDLVALPKEKAKQMDAVIALIEELADRWNVNSPASASNIPDGTTEDDELPFDDDLPE